MKIAILSTETKHHTYFINRLYERFDIAAIIYERRRLAKNYQTGPFFSDEEDKFEERFFDEKFGGTASELPEKLARRVIELHSVNQAGVAELLRALHIQVLVVFGTGRIQQSVISAAEWGSVNVHRGLAEFYRGLDSDLWAISEGRLDHVGVTLHSVDHGLDTGEIYACDTIKVSADDEIFHLRYHTSVLATDLMIEVLERFRDAQGPIEGRPQKVPGPYYTAMSLDEKMKTLDQFMVLRQGAADERD